MRPLRQQGPDAPAARPGTSAGPPADVPADVLPAGEQRRQAFYPRLLGLRHLRLRGWQRALLGEGTLVLAVLLVLADLASAWTLVVLPPAVALVVKAHDVLAGMLAGPGRSGP